MGVVSPPPENQREVLLDIPLTSTATLTPSRFYFKPFKLGAGDTIGRAWLTIATTQAVVLVSIGIYDANGLLIIDSGPREVPNVGYQELALPDTALPPGNYFAGLHLQAGVTTASFGVNTNTFGFVMTSTTLPTALSASTVTYTMPAFGIKVKERLTTKGLFTYEATVEITWALNSTTLWGSSGTRFYTTTDGWATRTQMMVFPTFVSGDAIAHVIIYNGELYVLTAKAHLYRSNGLLSSSTWTDITCPNLNANAIGRPLALSDSFNAMIFQGEYSNTPNELSGGPKIHKYNPATGVWTQSANFPNARHIHSLIVPGSAVMYVSVGDSSWGADIGIWRLTLANLGVANGGYSDTWVKVTTTASTTHYGVDFWVHAGITGIPDGIYHASDRPGYHMLYTKTTGTLGSFCISAEVFRTNTDPTETVRALGYEPTGKNFYWITAETLQPTIYFSPPPFVQSYPLYRFPVAPAFIGRWYIQGNYMFNFVSKIHIEKFVGQ